jgi:geranylgeranyl diphosphate synthase type I
MTTNGHVTDLPATADRFHQWLAGTRAESAAAVRAFVAERCREHIDGAPDADVLARVLSGYVGRGKLLRSAFVRAGWSAVAADSAEVVRAAASVELLHCFALMQDDVMDGSRLRRGEPSAHVRFAQWHRQEGLAGSPDAFGEAAAVLAADLCLVWSEQMLRESGVGRDGLARGMRRFDRLRSELAVGQFRDLINDARRDPPLAAVRDVARAKSGNYTVRRPLELGADMAGGSPALLRALGSYGEAVGEAFQLRDDLLGLFGDPADTGKPSGEDLRARKATCVVVLAREHAGRADRRELDRMDHLDRLEPADLDRYLTIVERSGARDHAESLIRERVAEGEMAIEHADMPDDARRRLLRLSRLCVDRIQ